MILRFGLILVFVAFPLLELALLIALGQHIGFWWTMAILVATAIIGGSILHAQGFSAMQRVMGEMQKGRPPIEPVVDGMFLMFAGLLLLTPGLITDAIGGLLLVPPLRRHIARFALLRLLGVGDVVFAGRYEESQRGARPHEPQRDADGNIVIDGEWERVDDSKSRRRPPDPSDHLRPK